MSTSVAATRKLIDLLLDDESGEDELLRAVDLNAALATFSDFLNAPDSNQDSPTFGMKPLTAAMLRNFKMLTFKILNHITVNEFLNSFKFRRSDFKGEEAKVAYENAIRFIERLLEYYEKDKQYFPKYAQEFMEEFRGRKIFALMLETEGETTLYGIPWSKEGFTNYFLVNKWLFEKIDTHQKMIVEAICAMPVQRKQNSEITVKVIEQAIKLMRDPQLTLESSSIIVPILVGTRAGSELHAQGALLFKNQYLMIDRSSPRPDESGISIYKKRDSCSETDFKSYVERALNSSQGLAEKCLDWEEYITDINDVYCIKMDHIPLPQQKPKNCTTASPEGLFVSCVYCLLLEEEVDSKLAKELSLAYTEVVFNTNKLCVTKEFLNRMYPYLPTHELGYLHELKQFLEDNIREMKSNFKTIEKDTKEEAALKEIQELFNKFQQTLAEKEKIAHMADISSSFPTRTIPPTAATTSTSVLPTFGATTTQIGKGIETTREKDTEKQNARSEVKSKPLTSDA